MLDSSPNHRRGLLASSSGVAATASACAERTPIDMRPNAEKRRHSRRTNPMRSEWPGRSLQPFAAERVRKTDGTDWQRWCGGPRSSSRPAFQRFLMSSGLTMIASAGKSSSGAFRVRAAVSQFLVTKRASATASPGSEYRERMKPIEEEFRLRHPEHGSSRTVGGGPIHCSRCCPPPPLSPDRSPRSAAS